MKQKPNSLVMRLARVLSRVPVARQVAAQLTAPVETDDTYDPVGSAYGYDRLDYDREKILAECLQAWRINPVARGIVRTMTAFVVGKGISLTSDDEPTAAFLAEWWDHRLNRIGRRLKDWHDEKVRSGNLFFLFSVDQVTGMTYVRAVPADSVQDIETTENDIEQPIRYIPTETGAEPWPAYQPGERQARFMVHFAFNRPVGAVWGEPELAPMLKWIGRLSMLLEDRARLNHFRAAFMYVVQMANGTPQEVKDKTKELNANPPKSGSVLVTTPAEQWGVLSAQLDSFDANVDITAIKKFVASGVTFPLHWLAEPESSTRTTAEAAGTPTFRTLEQGQLDFVEMLVDLARIACEVRARYESKVQPTVEIVVSKPDITERDNGALALAANRVWPVVMDLFDRKFIEAEEVLRLVYRMIAEPHESPDQAIQAIRKDPRYRPGDAPTPEPDPQDQDKGSEEE